MSSPFFDNQFKRLAFQKHIERVQKLPVVPQLALLAIVLFALFAGTITPKLFALIKHSDTAAAAIPLTKLGSSTATTVGINTDAFKDANVIAKAAYVFDVRDQKALFKKNESAQLPLASVTKLMTALIAQEVLEEKQPVTISEQAVKQDGDSGLAAGERFGRLTLSDFSLMSSSNDGAYALAVAAGNALVPQSGATGFVNAMNVRAQELGLTQTYYKNPTGLDLTTTEAGAYGSAHDMAFLMEYILKNQPSILAYTTEDDARVYSEDGKYHDAENTDYYVDKIPGLIGSKTGYTDLAGGNLIVAFNVGLNHPVIAVVLGSTVQGRFTDILELVKDTQRYYGNAVITQS